MGVRCIAFESGLGGQERRLRGLIQSLSRPPSELLSVSVSLALFHWGGGGGDQAEQVQHIYR